MLFGDECAMQQFVTRHMNITRSLGKRFEKKYVVAIMRHPPSQMMWGAMSCRGAADLYFVLPNTTMNRPKYVELVKQKLKLHKLVNGCTIVMQTGASCHRPKVAAEFLKRNNISVLEWLRNSPDLNPIENLWTIMKDKMAYKQLWSTENLRQAVKEEWVTGMAQEYCQSHLSSH